MNFERKLIPGQFIKRYKRFFVDVKIKDNRVTAHCPNTGSMMGLLKEGNRVWLTESNDPKRKLKYTLQIIENKQSKIGINTHLTNKIILDALNNNSISKLRNIDSIKQEVKFGKNTRFDFLLSKKNKNIFIEVKNVTLSRINGIAEFPDAITARGLKHIQKLLEASQKGYDIYLIYVIQRNDCNKFKIANDIDHQYFEMLKKAVKKKLKVLCYDCKFLSKGIKINREIEFNI